MSSSGFVFNSDILKPNMGFPTPSADDDEEAYAAYRRWKDHNEYKISQQLPRYQKLFATHNVRLNTRRVKGLIRKGVPPEFRGEVWFTTSGAKARMKNRAGVYDGLLAQAQELIQEYQATPDDGEDRDKRLDAIEYIENDLERTFPELEFFTRKKNLDRLRNILCAYSIHNPDIGYCQGLNFVAGIFLYFMNEEEKAFWTLEICLDRYLPHDMYDPTLNGVYCESFVLSCLVNDRKRSVHQKMRRLGFDDNEYAIFATQWFMCLFLGILPIETALRVMDAFLLEGNKIIFRVAMTILTMAEPHLEQMSHKGEVINFLKTYCGSLYDVRTLIKRSFRIRNFQRAQLRRLRMQFRQRGGNH